MNTQDELNRRLFEAAKKGDTETARALVEKGANLEARDNHGMTALIWAVQYEHAATALSLVEAGANVNARGKDNVTALMSAARHGLTDVLNALVDAGANLEARDLFDRTALMLAAAGGHTATVRELLDAGADVNARVPDKTGLFAALTTAVASMFGAGAPGETALIAAAAGGHVEAARVLLDAGANVNAARNDDATALMLAALGGHAAVARVLLDAGADPEAVNANGVTALMLAAMGGHTAAVRELLGAGAKVNAATANGETALIAAALGGHAAVVRELLDADANVNAARDDGLTALMAAAMGGHAAVARVLLDAGAKVNAAAANGETALMFAAAGGHTAAARVLLDADADAAQAAASWRGTEFEAVAFASLFAVGAFDPDADRLADCCREALAGMAGAAGDAGAEHKALEDALTLAQANGGGQTATPPENAGRANPYPQVADAVEEESQGTRVGAWRENVDDEEFAEDPVACIEKNAPPLLAPFLLARYADALEGEEKAGARQRALSLFRHMLARRSLQGGKDPDGTPVMEKSAFILNNDLDSSFETFEDLRRHLGKEERRSRLNI